MGTRSLASAAIAKARSTEVITDDNVTAISNRVATLEGYNLHTRLANLEARLALYESHTHGYTDATIADTEDGTGTTTTTTKSTGGVE